MLCRYWARSFAGWQEFVGVRPNAAHEALARLQRLGWVGGLITQNVDRLHHQAGSRDVGTSRTCGVLVSYVLSKTTYYAWASQRVFTYQRDGS